MQSFINRFGKMIVGVVSGFDRLVFRGYLSSLFHEGGIMAYLSANRVLLKDLPHHAEKTTRLLREASCAIAQRDRRPVIDVRSPHVAKEDLARSIMARDRIRDGLVAVLTAVEPCTTWEYYRDAKANRLRPRLRQRKCLYLYHYLDHPRFGFMHARIQTWFPFDVQVWLNGREWLAKQMDESGLGYRRQRNCFPWLANPTKAQALLNRQPKLDWPHALGQIARKLNPAHNEIFRLFPIDYYWTAHQSEWATDVMFRNAGMLSEVYPALLQHAMIDFHSADVMRFLGGKVHGRFLGEIVTDFKNRPEGVRIKHRVERNWVKMYNKEGSVLRVETTINDPSRFKVFRTKQGDPEGNPEWRPVRKGVADLQRRVEVSQACNDRYLEAMAPVKLDTPLGTLVRDVCRPTTCNGKRIRALRPWSQPDNELLAMIGREEFLLNGFRNRDLRARLYAETPVSEQDRRRQTARVSRMLRMLRAHGIVRKVQRTHRYLLTERGTAIVKAITRIQQVTLAQLEKIPA